MESYYKSRDNFVPALREKSTLVEVEVQPAQLPAAPQTVLLPHAGYEDRAKGFGIATAPLAAATGFVVLLIGIAAFGVPALSVVALLLALGGFTAAWLVAYIVYTFVSPDGSLFMHTLLMWAYLRRDQRERHLRYLRAMRDGDHE